MSVARFLGGSGSRIVVPPIVRPPLAQPLPKPVRDGDIHMVTLPWDPPEHRDFLRANLWAVEMPGAPWIPGASTIHPERILSWYIDRYRDEGFQRAYLEKYAGFQLTHFYLSPGDSMLPDDGPRHSLSQFCKTVEFAKRYVPYVGVMLASKYFTQIPGGLPALADFPTWKAFADPLLDALLPLVDEVSPAWEWDLWCQSSPVAIDVIKYIGDRCHDKGVSCWNHHSTHYTSWQANGEDRFTWWFDLGDSVDGINYQSNPNWTTREYQDRMIDTLWFFGQQGNRWKFRAFEDLAWLLWNGDRQKRGTPPVDVGDPITPEDGDCRGYYACCTYDNVHGTDAKVWGFGNGGRRPDGRRL